MTKQQIKVRVATTPLQDNKPAVGIALLEAAKKVV